MRTLRLMLLSLLVGLLISPVTVSAEPAARRQVSVSPEIEVFNNLQGACAGNRLANGDFEGGFSERGRGEISVANGWNHWYNPSPGTDGYNYIPEYKPEDAQVFGMRRVHSGRFAQKWFTTFATHTAGLYQQVSGIPVGSRLQFSAWAQVWSNDLDGVEKSEKPGNYRVMVGIDPFGGTDYNSNNIVWSDLDTFAYDAYKQLSVRAVARNNVVTVFLRGEPEFRVKHNDSYWDDACLIASVPTNTPAPPTNTPLPTDTPTITPTATPTYTPTNTLIPTNTSTRTPTPTSTFTATPLPTATPTPTPTPPSPITQLATVVTENSVSGIVLLLATAGVFLLLFAAGIRPGGRG